MTCYLHDKINFICLVHILLSSKIDRLLDSLRYRIADVNLVYFISDLRHEYDNEPDLEPVLFEESTAV